MMLRLATLGLLAATAAAAPALAADCKAPTAPLYGNGVEVLKVVHVITGADGNSQFEDTTLKGVSHPFMNTTKMVQQTVLSTAAKVSLVSGPANETIPLRPAPAGMTHKYTSMFLLLAGSSFVTLKDGTERELTPGTLAIFDDSDSKSGHGGRTGPCGYVSLSVGPPVAAAAETH